MSNDSPTRLEQLCEIADEFTSSKTSSNKNISNNNDQLLSKIELSLKAVASEFSFIVSSSSSFPLEEYASLMKESCQVIASHFLLKTSTISSLLVSKEDEQEQEKSVVGLKYVKTLRACAFLLLNCRLKKLNSSNSSSSTTNTEKELWMLAQSIECFLTSSNNSCSSYSYVLQKQVCKSAQNSILENFRVPIEVFDPRESLHEVLSVLSRDSLNNTEENNDNNIASSLHLSTLIPLFTCGENVNQHQHQRQGGEEEEEEEQEENQEVKSTRKGGGGVSAFDIILDAVESVTKTETSSQKSKHVVIIDDEKLHLTAPFLTAQVASNTYSILSDVTNLLFRVSAQTPQNSPSIAFLTFLVCDISVNLAPHFSLLSRLSQQQGNEGNEESAFLFSSKLFPRASFPSSSSSQAYSKLLAQFDVALGCAVDCLLSDIETYVTEGHNKFEASLPFNSHLRKKKKKKNPQGGEEEEDDEEEKERRKQQEEVDREREKKFGCSSGMFNLFVSLIQPVLSAIRFFVFSSSSSEQKERCRLRMRILMSMIRLTVSFWMRRSQQPQLQQQEEEQQEEENAKIEKEAAKKDIKVFFDFLMCHPFCRHDVEWIRQTMSTFIF